MRTEVLLIIPDIHNKIDRAETIIKNAGADKVIFLGDYFDDFGDSHIDARKTAKWLKESLNKENRIHLWGNHDVCYAFPNNPYTRCTGFTESKNKAVQEELTEKEWSKLKFFHFEQGFLFTHAGLHSSYFPENNEDIDVFLNKESDYAFRLLKKNKSHYFFRAGYSRGGQIPFGGIIWCDFLREFIPNDNAKQIFGHTPQRIPTLKGNSLCIDTHLMHYAKVQNNVASYYEYKNL